ncbi:hypothetical protein FIU89_12585 [Roseovarius sp. THAF27]|uniref:DUF6630 family protein n=1 Tax=Roseovarius sp. THAF27 TaxID=2587850 RepID=UPI001267AC6F|nr:hypothetical protein [Roseovarius sp. THAF27]QFT81452.1 hypothetical protein FIU89_12585 [Roseovarius sp. THAF27]
MGMMSWLVAGLAGTAALIAPGAGMTQGMTRAGSGGTSEAPLSDAQILQAVDELTEGDPVAITAAKAMLSGQAGGESPFEYYRSFAPDVAVLGHALWSADRLAELDWAAGTEDSLDQFDLMVSAVGLDLPGGIAEHIDAGAAAGTLRRGDVVGEVYAMVWPRLRAEGYHVVGLNTDSDMHMMFVSPEAAALRWQSVAIGPNMYFEVADWQFSRNMQDAGLAVSVPDHPGTHTRTPPKPD